ncbi:MAG: serine hydrolase domain-containing protein [Vagococcus salmoninarum]|uniref:serine hydrolase domain-containing protein n=1 Tax=Vagococcus salmoninarum TaxID=2739 RepID=UPI003F97D479
MEKIINKITHNKENINLTIGIREKNKTEITVFGKNGQELPNQSQRYEIGSLTKIFTATLLARYLQEDKIDVDQSIQSCLTGLTSQKEFPSIRQLATHTSGYHGNLPFTKIEYFKIISQVLLGGANPFTSKTPHDQMLETINQTTFEKRTHKFEYSNINYSILGCLIAELADKPYPEVMTEWLADELKLAETTFKFDNVLPAYNSFNKLQENWLWQATDTAIASGGLYSTIEDLLEFVRFHSSGKIDYFEKSHQKLALGTKNYDMALGWKKENANGTLWHNGGTGCFSSFLGFNPQIGKEVVILSNYRSFQIDKLGLELLK